MESHRGFVGVSVLLAILVGLVVIGGGMYYVTHRTSTNKTAEQQDTVASTSENAPQSFLTFVSPQAGAIVDTNVPTAVQYSLSDPSILSKFPDFKVAFELDDLQGQFAGSMGEDSLLPPSGTYQWDIGKYIRDDLYPEVHSGSQYRIKTTLQYAGNAPSSCSPESNKSTGCIQVYPEPVQSEIEAAKAYESDSGLFTINISPDTLLLSCTVSPRQSAIVAGTPYRVSDLLSVATQNTDGNVYVAGYGITPDTTHSFAELNQTVTFSKAGQYPYTVTVNAYKAYSGVHPETTTCQTTLTVSESSGGSGLQTYTNPQYGFSLQYPSGVQINTTAATQQSYSANINNGAVIATFGQITKTFNATEPGWGDNGVVSTFGKLIVSVSTDSTDVRNCMTAPQAVEVGPSNIQTKQINGVSFLSYHIDEPATGLFSTDQTYTTLRGGACYSIDAHIDGGASGHMNAMDATSNDAVFAQLAAELDSIAQSFRFTN